MIFVVIAMVDASKDVVVVAIVVTAFVRKSLKCVSFCSVFILSYSDSIGLL